MGSTGGTDTATISLADMPTSSRDDQAPAAPPLELPAKLDKWKLAEQCKSNPLTIQTGDDLLVLIDVQTSQPASKAVREVERPGLATSGITPRAAYHCQCANKWWSTGPGALHGIDFGGYGQECVQNISIPAIALFELALRWLLLHVHNVVHFSLGEGYFPMTVLKGARFRADRRCSFPHFWVPFPGMGSCGGGRCTPPRAATPVAV